MNIYLDWIGDFVQLPPTLSDREIAERITMKVCEVEDYERFGDGGQLVLDIDNKSLTHRPDLWGHFGMAREFAAAFGLPLKDPFDAAWAAALGASLKDKDAPVTLQIESDSANRGFLGLSVNAVTVAESPEWMRRRLNAVGMRPINSIVDISNYVMLELGMPNHIFDRNRINGGKIVVRRAGDHHRFVTLDEQERQLIPSDTLVCDSSHPLAIAGIMGGLESSVNAETSRIMIEVANWADHEIRRTGVRLGLRTDSSLRYEKGLDSQGLERTILRILDLLIQLNPEIVPVGGLQRANMPAAHTVRIKTDPKRLSRILGEQVSAGKLRSILETLAFTVEESSDGGMMVTVPSWRATKDIECEADIVEEVGRIIGYDNIVPTSPVHEIESLRLSPAKRLLRRVGDFLVLRGRALEIMTYPLIGEELLVRAAWPRHNEGLVLANSITPERDRMRPSLVPSLLEAASLNRKEHQTFRFFEIGRSYMEGPGAASLLQGKKNEKAEFAKDLYQVGIFFQDSFLELANLVEGLMSYLGCSGRLVPADPHKEHPLLPADWSGSHPHEFLDLQVGGRSMGFVLSLHPLVARNFKLRGRSALAILDLADLMEGFTEGETLFKPLSRFPGADFDVTVVIPRGIHAAEPAELVRSLGIPQIASVKVLDLFDLENTDRALTLRVHLRDPEKTMDAAFIRNIEERIVDVLEEKGYPLRT